jgi:hypothetical protein
MRRGRRKLATSRCKLKWLRGRDLNPRPLGMSRKESRIQTMFTATASLLCQPNSLIDPYFRDAASAGIGAVGTMMWAYLVPFHITQGPPLCGSVGKASN